MQLNLMQLKRLQTATCPTHALTAEQCQDLVGLALLDQALRPTALGLRVLAQEGFNTWEEAQERARDLHSDYDSE